MLKRLYALLRDTVWAYIEDEAMTRGAAISFYTVTSLGPILVIVVAVAGLAFGRAAAQGAVVQELSGLMGHQSALLIQSALKGASGLSSGLIAGFTGIIALLITASGVFVEMQTALNVIWGVPAANAPVSRMIRARAQSLGLIAAMGFLLLASLLISAALSALGGMIEQFISYGTALIRAANVVISLALIGIMFGAIYKVLPDRDLAWRDVGYGAAAATVLFTIGKYLISLYIGSSAIVTSYGAAASVIVMLLWLYYSAQIFLLGAELAKVLAKHRGVKLGEVTAPS